MTARSHSRTAANVRRRRRQLERRATARHARRDADRQRENAART